MNPGFTLEILLKICGQPDRSKALHCLYKRPTVKKIIQTSSKVVYFTVETHSKGSLGQNTEEEVVVDHILVAAVARNTPFSLLFDCQSENPLNEPNRLDSLPVRRYSMGSRFAIYFRN